MLIVLIIWLNISFKYLDLSVRLPYIVRVSLKESSFLKVICSGLLPLFSSLAQDLVVTLFITNLYIAAPILHSGL